MTNDPDDWSRTPGRFEREAGRDLTRIEKDAADANPPAITKNRFDVTTRSAYLEGAMNTPSTVTKAADSQNASKQCDPCPNCGHDQDGQNPTHCLSCAWPLQGSSLLPLTHTFTPAENAALDAMEKGEVTPRSTYGWIITEDKINDPRDEMDCKPRVGVSGPGNISNEMLAKLKAGEGFAFRMKDDDGEIYYEGRFLGDEKSEDAFGPLDDFGMPDAGCTSIEYRNAQGGWETL